MIAIRAVFKTTAPCATKGFPVLAQLAVGLCAGLIFTVNKQIKIHGQPLAVQAVGNAGSLLCVEFCLLWRAVRLTERQAITALMGKLDEFSDHDGKFLLFIREFHFCSLRGC